MMDLSDQIKAIIYARVSTGDQVERYSLDSQVERCVAHLQSKYNYQEDELIVLIEEGISGDNPNRPSLLHGLHLIENGVGRKFIVLHPDRLSRDLGLQTTISQRIWQAGADLEFVEMPLDKDSPESLFMFNVQGAVAAYNKQKILANSKRGRRQKVKKGMIPGLNKKFGYIFDKESDTLIEHPEEKQAYLLMVDWIINGLEGKRMSTSLIAEELALRGIPAPKGGAWRSSVVSKILNDESYTGKFYYGKTRVVQQNGESRQVPVPRDQWHMIEIPAYIDELTLARVKRALSENSTRLGGRQANIGYLIKGMARCGRCGAAVAAAPVSNTKSNKLYYYGCTAKSKTVFEVGTGKSNPVCRGRNWRQDVIDKIVWEFVLDCLRNPEKIIEEVVKRNSDHTHLEELQRRNEIYQKRIKEKQNERKKVIHLFTRETISEEELDEMLKPIDETLKRLHGEQESVMERLQEARLSFDELQLIKKSIDEFREQIAFEQITFEGKRALIERFISKVVLCEDSIEISTTWTPPEPDPDRDTKVHIASTFKLTSNVTPSTLAHHNSLYSQKHGRP